MNKKSISKKAVMTFVLPGRQNGEILFRRDAFFWAKISRLEITDIQYWNFCRTPQDASI
jgi:hypothetical protein